jgi:RNA-binding protein NOB1
VTVHKLQLARAIEIFSSIDASKHAKMADAKPVHTIVLDAGPIIKNEPPVSSLLAQSECLVTTPSVIAEIRDATARARIETTLIPFLTLRRPKAESYQIVSQFAKKTGDFAVLSRVDLEVIAVAYEVECERNGGNWRLRSTPGQIKPNGTCPTMNADRTPGADENTNPQELVDGDDIGHAASRETTEESLGVAIDDPAKTSDEVLVETEPFRNIAVPTQAEETAIEHGTDSVAAVADLTAALQVSETISTTKNDETLENQETISISPEPELSEAAEVQTEQANGEGDEEASSESDSDGWITPSNLRKHQEKDAAGRSDLSGTASKSTTLQVATITTDFALQNVLLQMNLNLLSASLQRVRNLKTFVLRCHACFNITKDMTKQFCPRCGKPTLTRVSCSTNQNGEFKIHLKKNFQWNTRGDRYSIPKPASGSSNGRAVGGGKGGWGHQLILAEDQKEYERAVAVEKRQKKRDPMDEDFLPSILSGHRPVQSGRPRVGAGRNINAKKRK